MTDPIDPNALPVQPVPVQPAGGDQRYVPPPPFAPPSDVSPPPAAALPSPYPPYVPLGSLDELPIPMRRRASAWVWVLAAAAVVLLLASVGNVVLDSRHVDDAQGTEGRTLVLPTTVDDYRKVQTLDLADLLDQMGASLNSLGVASGNLDVIKAGLYARSGAQEPSFIFIGMLVADVPELQNEVDSRGVAAAVEDFTGGVARGGTTGGGAVTGDIKSVAPGPLGGSMRCGVLTVLSRDVGVCGWGDRSAFAACLVIDPYSLDGAASLVRDFRAAAEH